MLVFIVTPCLFYVILESDGKTKAPCFCGKKMPPVCSWRSVTIQKLLSRKGVRSLFLDIRNADKVKIFSAAAYSKRNVSQLDDTRRRYIEWKSLAAMSVRKQYPLGESLLTSLLTFFFFSIRLNPWKHRRMYELKLKDLKELVNLLNLSNLCNFLLFISTIKGHRSNRKPRICCVAKPMSCAFFVEFRVFQREFLRN